MANSDIQLAGGEGGHGGDGLSTQGTGGAGGDGGSATFSRGDSVGIDGLVMTGGNGHLGGNGKGNNAIGGVAGNGGDVTATIAKDLSVWQDTVLQGGKGQTGGRHWRYRGQWR